MVVWETDAAAIVTDVMMALGLRGHDVRVTYANGPRLMRLGALMLAEFGLGERISDKGAPPGDGVDQALVAQHCDCPARGAS